MIFTFLRYIADTFAICFLVCLCFFPIIVILGVIAESLIGQRLSRIFTVLKRYIIDKWNTLTQNYYFFKTALIRSILDRNECALELILDQAEEKLSFEEMKKLLFQTDEDNYSALIVGVTNGNKEIVELLLNRAEAELSFDEMKLFFSQADHWGFNALIGAVTNGDKEIVELLLNKAEEILNPDEIKQFLLQDDVFGDNALFRAEGKDNEEILELILNKAEEKLGAEEMKKFCSSQLSENNQKLDSNSEKKNHVEQEKKNIEIKHQSQLSENNQKTTNNQTKRTCKKCDQMYPLNEDYFGYTPSGNFRHSCRKCMSLVAKKHDKENPDMVKKRQAQRKQRITKSPLARDYSPKDLKIKLYALSNAKCHYCKKSFKQDDLDLEHQIPVVQDGPDIQSNIVLACGFCNKEKHGKTENQYRQFLKERGRNVEF